MMCIHLFLFMDWIKQWDCGIPACILPVYLWYYGTATAFGFMTWVLTIDWPLNFGGKPFFLPAWIPIILNLRYCLLR